MYALIRECEVLSLVRSTHPDVPFLAVETSDDIELLRDIQNETINDNEDVCRGREQI